MAVVLPFNNAWREYVVDQDGSASFTADVMETRKVRILLVNVAWTAIASTAGTLSVQGTEDPANASTSWVTLTASQTNGAQPSAGTAGAILLAYEFVPTWTRLVYTRSAGGGAAQFDAWCMGRSV